MIKHYSDHAANERTYLAWVRTGVTISVLGFVIEKFVLLLDAQPPPIPAAGAWGLTASATTTTLSLFLIMVGILEIVLATWQFAKTRRAIEREEIVPYHDLLPAYLLTGMLLAASSILLVILLRFI